MPDKKEQPQAGRAERPIAQKAIQNIFEYVTDAPVFESVTYALIVMCIFVLAISLLFPELTLLILIFSFALSSVSAVVFHIQSDDIQWSLSVLDIFSGLFFGQSSKAIKTISQDDRVDLALRLNVSLKFLSICLAICSLTLFIEGSLNTSGQVSPIQYPTSLKSPTTVRPVAFVTVTVEPSPSSTTPLPKVTLPLTSSLNVHLSPLLKPSATPTAAYPKLSVTSIPTAISHPAKPSTITSTATPAVSQLQPTVEAYKELLNSILPKVVIADVIRYSQARNDIGVGKDEYVVIVNYGDGADMSGWYVSDALGHIYYFENFYLDHANVVSLHTGVGVDTDSDLYWGLNNPMWVMREPHLFLFDNTNAVVDDFSDAF